MKRFLMLLFCVLMLSGMAIGCARSMEWTTMTAFFEEFEDVPNADDAKSILTGHQYTYSGSKEGYQIQFDDMMIWIHRWDGSITAQAKERQNDIRVVLFSRFKDKEERDQFYAKTLDALIVELGDVQAPVNENGQELLRWSKGGVSVDLYTLDTESSYDIYVEYKSVKSQVTDS